MTSPGGSHVTLRGLMKVKAGIDIAAREIQFVRTKGLSALTIESDRMVFRGMASCLDAIMDKFHRKWSEAVEYAETHSDAIFPTSEDNKLFEDTKLQYYEAKGYEIHILSMQNPPQRSSLSFLDASQIPGGPRPRAILPKIPIKTFSGDISQWPSFKQLFTSLIKNELSLSPVERFHYLVGYLQGPAFDVIKHIPVAEENFEQAWEALLRVYDDKRKIASNHLEHLLSFKPASGKPTYASLQSYLSGVMESITSLKNLGIPNLSNYLLCELALRGLDHVTREAFEIEQIGEEFPSCEALEEFIQGRCHVLRLTQDPVSKPSTSDANSKPESKSPSAAFRSPNKFGSSSNRKSHQALLAHSSKPNTIQQNILSKIRYPEIPESPD
ncbi:hypothetical protein GE061_000617 [Apolygus lucorum]|uniref:Uncharacterized protein n=1 Tax=Apolygus lucorum TaxID=248454 RepID=A0A8S9Y4U9_APOLU|nr:hypothetical protein GE061_000617 [Apolygus lucorum]